MAEAVLIAGALVIPSLTLLFILEATTPSPVSFDAAACKFRRRAPPATVGPQSWARTVAEEHSARGAEGAEAQPLSEEEAALALAVQLSLDEQQQQQPEAGTELRECRRPHAGGS